MPQGRPASGEKYRHFKDKLYQIVTIAKHSETGEELVIYQALYGDFGVYARPLTMFVSEVDHEKYPEVEQKYRFELVESGAAAPGRSPEPVGTTEADRSPEPAGTTEADRNPEPAEAVKTIPGTYRAAAAAKDITELLMDFYDAESYDEKYKILASMKDDITNVMIDNMAVVLDLVIPEGDVSRRYEELKKCLRTHKKYETGRF